MPDAVHAASAGAYERRTNAKPFQDLHGFIDGKLSHGGPPLSRDSRMYFGASQIVPTFFENNVTGYQIPECVL
jgi:hypothetical protein